MDNILKSVQKHVFNLFKKSGRKSLVFHNYVHTVDVVSAAGEIADGSNISAEEKEVLLIGAWFHDTGYLQTYKGHEEVSVNLATEFLKDKNYSEEGIALVKGIIMATKMPQSPTNLLEEIMCDADLAHFGKKEYQDKSRLLRLEWELTKACPVDDEWATMEIGFLSEHSYFTEYAQLEFFGRKVKNLLMLQDINEEKKQKAAKSEKKVKPQKVKVSGPERGIETMLRVTYRNHINLSSIADNKANIMLSINAIIISFSLSILIPSGNDNPQLMLPTLILLLVCTATIVLATISTRPKVFGKNKPLEKDQNQKVNLLFFGDFFKISPLEYQEKMEKLMENKEELYRSMIKDMHNLGVVLERKYKYLRITYNVFMYGLITAVSSFILSFIF